MIRPEEMRCKCGCRAIIFDDKFLERLNTARGRAKTPFRITSGYRCPAHNAAVGSTSQNHVSGRAADIACTHGALRLRIILALLESGFRRIGVGQTYVHVDDMPDMPHSIWVY